MSIEVSDELCRELAQGTPVEIVDPATRFHYVVLPKEQYDRVRALLSDEPLSEEEQRHLLHLAGKRAGWDDPEMDVYNELDPRRGS